MLGVQSAPQPWLTQSCSLPDPLSPDNVTLSRAEEQNSLEARWSVPGGHRDFYLVTLQEGQDSAPSRNISVGGDNDHVTFHGLSPGQQYSVQVVVVAGPHRASAQSSAAWTGEQKGHVWPWGCSCCLEGAGGEAGMGTGHVGHLLSRAGCGSEQQILPAHSSW